MTVSGFPIVVTLPIAWTAVEWLRTYFPIGFPWNLLGYTAYRNLELIQFAEFTGVYGVSALIIFFNVVVYVVALPASIRAALRAVSLGTLTVPDGWRYSSSVRSEYTCGLQAPSGKSVLKVAMVQGNIPQIASSGIPSSSNPAFERLRGPEPQAARDAAPT